EQSLIITALRDELRKLKGKAIVDNTITTHTIDLEMFKFYVKPLAPRLLNNRIVHSDYLRLNQEQAAILREVEKKDERGIVIKNKARLVAQGHTQEEGIDYDEVFAPIAKIEAIRLFLAYASFKDFVVYQMDVKSAFLYGRIEEEVYVCQPPDFEDPNFPNKVYKVENTLYGLHQAPRALMIAKDMGYFVDTSEVTTGYGKSKKVNDKEQIQALVDKTKVIVMEDNIRSDLCFDEAEGTVCLLNEVIFEGLAHMGTMASAIICLADNQKFNLSKYIFDNMGRTNDDEIFGVDDLAGEEVVMETTTGVNDSAAPTTDVIVQEQEMSTTIPAAATIVTTVVPTPRAKGIVFHKQKQSQIPTVSSSKDKGKAKMIEPEKKHKPKRKHTQESEVPPIESPAEQNLPSPSNDLLPSGEDSLKLMELMELCTNLSNKVLELESDVIDIKSTYQERIDKLEGRVERLEEENRVLKELKNIDDDVKINLEKAQAEAVNKEEPADVEEVLEGVKVAKLMTEVVTTARATKVSVPRKRRGVIIQDPKESTTTATVQP
nr:copia protein [Tanacetum cinerariifolium]